MVLLVATQNKTLLDDVAKSCWNFLSLQATSGINNETLKAMVRTFLLMKQSLNSSKRDDTPTFNRTRNWVPSYLLGKGEITTFFILPSLMIIILFSILTKRNHDKKACGVFGRRPGLCIPINLVDSYENRIGYACAFGVTASKCLDILLFGDYHTVFEGSMHILQMDNQGKATWTTVLWNLMAMLIIGLAYYPMFLCLSTDYTLLGGIIGFVYTGF
ncbi:stimulated by retinoic acid gene 6 protein-like, partial [Actinia tenebrosa]|uniref:Stimulated by retinoic acid gene 6 protein-like n=1 Tax=Actinia tenebrosa TaxID=6105 RepID=A0A6P8HWF0_ACTTE